MKNTKTLPSILKEYISRFKKSGEHYPEKFYTQLKIEEYYHKLPYIFDIENFCLRLLIAHINKEKICIYSDYDTDAVTATAIMYHGLIQLGYLESNLSFYAPDRFTEGYGINPQAIASLALQYDLIVSVDCGINSVSEANWVIQAKNQYIQNMEENMSDQQIQFYGLSREDLQTANINQTDKRGISDDPKQITNTPTQNMVPIADLIITDHHHLHGPVPTCLAVVNPRLTDVYNQNPDLRLLLNEKSSRLLQILQKTSQNYSITNQNQPGLSIDHLVRVEQIIQKIRNYPRLQNPQNFLSTSVTGAGVAWFCLVWLGYVLEEIGV